ncbi:uncharacterized protein [Euphorbia lathyris]|uniref:uncharacterized protein n=1 Tax=Euphorbia lathyris TaxID=212925 RepID=UPI003313FC02
MSVAINDRLCESSCCSRYGTVHRDLTLNHHEPLRPGHVKVSVDFVEIGYLHELIPVPSSYAKKLGEAEGSFTQWPKDLVLLCHDNEVSIPREQSGSKKQVDSGRATNESAINPKRPFQIDVSLSHLTEKCRYLQSFVSTFPKGNTFKMRSGKTAFNYSDAHDDIIYIMSEDVTQLLIGDRLSVSILQVFMLAMIDRYPYKFDLNSITFMCPSKVSATMLRSSPDASLKYMRHVMEQSSKRFIFCPYHKENHWILLVLSLANRVVHVFDSNKSGVHQFAIRLIMNKAFKNIQIGKGAHRNNQSLEWRSEKCSQQIGATECGFYVMRNMFEIVQYHSESENLTRDFATKSMAYSEEEINDVRDIWADYFGVEITSL